MQGFIVSEHMDIWPEALKELRWWRPASLHPRESVAQGLEAAAEAFLGLLKGKNFGKQLVKLILAGAHEARIRRWAASLTAPCPAQLELTQESFMSTPPTLIFTDI